MISFGFVIGFIGALMLFMFGKSILASCRQKNMDKRWAFHWNKVNEEQEKQDEERAERQRKLVEDKLQKAKERDQLRAKRHAAYLGVMKEPRKVVSESEQQLQREFQDILQRQVSRAYNPYNPYSLNPGAMFGRSWL